MDLSEKLRLLISTVNAEPKYFFYYDPITLDIIYLKNYFEEDANYPHIELLQSEIIDIAVPGINDFSVVEIDGEKQIVQKKKTVKIDTIEDIIYQIPKINSDPNIKISQANYIFDLLIEQDNSKKEFRIRLSSVIKDQYDRKSLNQDMSFYVTAENDPNILYKTLIVHINELLKNHYYTIPYNDFEGTDCNIFSRRYFQQYLHMVIE
jgi:hypothetical protein